MALATSVNFEYQVAKSFILKLILKTLMGHLKFINRSRISIFSCLMDGIIRGGDSNIKVGALVLAVSIQ